MRIAHNALFVITDVGGGNKKDTTADSNALSNFSLSNISLRWMVQEVVKSPDCDVKFAKDRVELLQRFNIPVEEMKRSPPPPPL